MGHLTKYIVSTALVWITLAASETELRAQEIDNPAVQTVQDAMYGRTMTAAVETLAAACDEDPLNDTLRFGLGISQFLKSAETWFSGMYRHGANPAMGPLSMAMPMGVPPSLQNAEPAPVTHEQFREILRTWLEEVRAAEATLAKIRVDQLKLPLHVGLFALDFDDSGVADDDEELWVTFGQVQRRYRPDAEGAHEFAIAFDRGDVSWLRGYCRVLMAVGELIMAYDTSELFERAAHVMFPKPVTEYDYLLQSQNDMQWMYVDIAVFIHLMNFPLLEPDRCSAAHQHLLEAVALAKEMWRYYDTEVDNDREWLPNPRQDAVMPDAELDDELRETWLLFLDEAQRVLNGQHLLRFWRTADGQNRKEGLGINLKRVLTEPRRFDLVLWIQGSGAHPYLERGPLTEPQLWRRFENVTGQRPLRYAFWFN